MKARAEKEEEKEKEKEEGEERNGIGVPNRVATLILFFLMERCVSNALHSSVIIGSVIVFFFQDT